MAPKLLGRPRRWFPSLCGGFVRFLFFRFLVLGGGGGECIGTASAQRRKNVGYQTVCAACDSYQYERNAIPTSTPHLPPKHMAPLPVRAKRYSSTHIPHAAPATSDVIVSRMRPGQSIVRRYTLIAPDVLTGMNVAHFLVLASSLYIYNI